MDDDSAARAALAAWPAAEPPDGFAQRAVPVVASRLRWPWIVAAACVPLVASLLVFTTVALRGGDGSVVAEARQTVKLGRRGVAVAEAGSSLSWRVAPFGAARVEQDRGTVFYRVELGGPFVVQLNDVQVRALGTCFRVEDSMHPGVKKGLTGATGALLSAAVVVTVYEGRVEVRGAQGTAEVAAGERVEVRGGRPTAAPVAANTAVFNRTFVGAPAIGATEAVAQGPAAAEIAALQARVRQLEQMQARAQGRESSTDSPPREKMRDFTSDELNAMARNCEIRFDTPPLGDESWKLNGKQAAQEGLSAEQQQKVADAVNALRTSTLQSLRKLYIELGGDPKSADALSAAALSQEILQKSIPQDDAAARAELAAERAGWSPPPPDPSQGTVPERYYRLMSGLGDAVEKAVTPIVGAAEAPALRDAIDGSHSTANGC